MKPVLSDNDRSLLEKRITEAEKITRTQIVLALVGRSDSYAEIPWKAFALGASLTGLLVFSLDLILLTWIQDTTVLISIVTTLAVAAFVVLLTILFPGFARLFLSDSRAETETRQYAESLFLSRELFSTARRTGILLLISRFERKVVIIPDKGLSNLVNQDNLMSIVALMKQPLAKNEFRQAMEIALDELIRIIEPCPSDEEVANELSDKIIEDKGL
ncbi:MAG: hypothetical protein E4H43_00125 [Bacteroidia bacterium]|nr:MAG: hypothetical protein E4H43_00125 [Bacteroidia bacterium]